MASDSLKDIGNIGLEGQPLPQKAEHFRTEFLLALATPSVCSAIGLSRRWLAVPSECHAVDLPPATCHPDVYQSICLSK